MQKIKCDRLCGILIILIGLLAFSGPGEKEVINTMTYQITSPSFSEGQTIPVHHTCDGPDVSPALTWTGAPNGTVTFALICDDPDAPVGTWVHWVVYNIPASKTSLPENVAKTEQLPDGTRQGINDFRRVGYGGPCPPPGPAHRYYFKLVALSKNIELPAAPINKAALLSAMEGHILATAQLMGRYKRQR